MGAGRIQRRGGPGPAPITMLELPGEVVTLTPGRLCRFPSAALTRLRLKAGAGRSEEGQGAGRGAAASPSLPLGLPYRTGAGLPALRVFSREAGN